MGIYSDGNVYGVCWDIYDESGKFIRRFEKIYCEKMNLQQILEVKEEYDKLNDDERKYATYNFYTNCTSSYDYDSGSFMSWFLGSKESLEKLFLDGDIRI